MLAIKYKSLFLFLACLSASLEANTLNKAIQLITEDKRKEAYLILEKVFSSTKGNEKVEAAELLSSAFIGETSQDPGFYAEYLVSSSAAFAKMNVAEQIRLLRLSGDYLLKKSKLDVAEKRYNLLAQIGTADEKDYSEYKKAWILINKNQHKSALDKLSSLLKTSPNSKLKLSIAFDMGRFWGEAPLNAVKDSSTNETSLVSSEERKEFFRGLQKSLLFPAKANERLALKQRASQFKDFSTLIELDLEAKSPNQDMACEKISWGQWPQHIKLIKNDSPYKMLLQCLGEESGHTRKLKAHERKDVLAFLSSLTDTQHSDVLHKARFLSNLEEYPSACQEYAKHFSEGSITDSNVCEEASEICFKALNSDQKAAQETAKALFSKAALCSKKEATSKALKLATRLYEIEKTSLDAFLFSSQNKDYLASSLIPDVIYEAAIKKNDPERQQKIAKTFFLEKSAVSLERKKSLEHYLGQSDNKASVNSDNLDKLYPLKKEGRYIEENIPLWIKASSSSKSSSVKDALTEACEDKGLQNSKNTELRQFCFENASLKTAWNWALKGINCTKDGLFVLRSWIALNAGQKIESALYTKSFIKDSFEAFNTKQYSKSLKTVSQQCAAKYPLSLHLKNLKELQDMASQKVNSLSALTKQINAVKAKLKSTASLPKIDDKMQSLAKDELIHVISNLEKALPQVASQEAAAAPVLEQFKEVFAHWKKELSN